MFSFVYLFTLFAGFYNVMIMASTLRRCLVDVSLYAVLKLLCWASLLTGLIIETADSLFFAPFFTQKSKNLWNEIAFKLNFC